MCFVIPKMIIERRGTTARLENGQVVDVSQFPECTANDFVIVTSGIAVSLVPADEARSMRSLIKETHEQLS